MRRRKLTFGLYADAEGLARVRSLVEDAVASRGARITTMSERPAADAYDFLAAQWAVEHPGQSSGARQPIELRVRLLCSLRTRRSLRKAVIEALCPEGTAPHTCHVPWSAA
ncbi:MULTISPECIES: hypothetical protein [Streptomyces]|uniref:hypothetical protein n=1 Tax=Streptomyces TaxID=1883 RepID=UPI00093CC87C|nr:MULTISPECIES: hypothetical protein [Streptomyces]MBP0932248.1 hypothetical protein [Streptomyces sp. KCTC 0041BP]OKI42817.1 hypothetical protein A6A28_21935 [Streptomyces sp. CB03578]WSS03646.1 hypothetical protein OG224_36890 [Streptomyces goshikiensis]GHD74726.1 hypothetical protein GCM10010336_49140 [Streptomyces goshikiensis]